MRTPTSKSIPAIEAIIETVLDHAPVLRFGLATRNHADAVMEEVVANLSLLNLSIEGKDVPHVSSSMIAYHDRESRYFLSEVTTSENALKDRDNFYYEPEAYIRDRIAGLSGMPEDYDRTSLRFATRLNADLVMRIAVAYASEEQIKIMFAAQDDFMRKLDALIEATPLALNKKGSIFVRYQPLLKITSNFEEWYEGDSPLVNQNRLYSYLAHHPDYSQRDEHKPLSAIKEAALKAPALYKTNFEDATAKILYDEYGIDIPNSTVSAMIWGNAKTPLNSRDMREIHEAHTQGYRSHRIQFRAAGEQIHPLAEVMRQDAQAAGPLNPERIKVPNRWNEVYAEETRQTQGQSSLAGSPYQDQPHTGRQPAPFRKNFD